MPLEVAILFNEPLLPSDHPEYAQEAGVLDSVDAFESALFSKGHQVTRIPLGDDLGTVLDSLIERHPDVVVNFCECASANSRAESYVAGILELLGIPYTGSPPECLSLAHDKARTKWLLAGLGVPTAEFRLVNSPEELAESSLKKWLRSMISRGPLFVKPAEEDASLGIDNDSVAVDYPAVMARLAFVLDRFGSAIVECYVPGREFNVSIIALPEIHVLPLAEIEFQTSDDLPWPIVTYASKWDPGSAADRGTAPRCPADVSPELARVIENAAVVAFNAAGCRDYARVDLRLSPDGVPVILEINANPDVGPSSGFARALRAGEIDYADFVDRLVQNAAEEQPRPPSRNGSPHFAESAVAVPVGPHSLVIRRLAPADRVPLLEMVQATGMFRDDEVEVADEILCEALRDGPAGHYQAFVGELQERAVGWFCFGIVPLSDASFDLYWIVVDPPFQGQGIGAALLQAAEQRAARKSGRWLLAETSSTDAYRPTREFYARNGYQIVGDIPDFYRPGDGKITFGKRLDSRESG